MSIVTRFAPSPTGYLHLGHVLSAWTAWHRARTSGGRFLLRMEDIDPGRCRPEFAIAIQEDLRFLGLDWDGPVRVQTRHMDDYAAVLASLAARDLIFPCFCSRADIERHVIASAPQGAGPPAPAPQGGGPQGTARGPDGGALYPGTCRDLPLARRAALMERPHALRLNMARAAIEGLSFHDAGVGIVAADPAQFGDVVLARKETPSSYHLCVTHDDAFQGVNLVTRGEDLREATHLHRLLQALMGWPTPDYAHHPLLTDNSGRRLAKRDGAVTVQAMRAAGMTRAEILDLAGRQDFGAARTSGPPA